MANIQSNDANSPPRDTAGTRLAAKRAARSAQKAASRGNTNAVEDATRQVAHAAAWLNQHGTKLWLGVGAVALIGVAWIGLAYYLNTKDNEAGNLLRSAVTITQGIVVAGDDTPPEDVLVPTFTSAKERATKALASYRDVAKRFGDSTAGRYARLGVANSLYELGKPAEASTEYTKLLEVAGSDVLLRARAIEGSGYALEAQQKLPDALKRFEELSKLGNGTYRVLGDYHRARLLVAQNKPAEAKALLEGMSKALAANTNEDERNGFESASESAEVLLQELGGKPTEKPRVNLMNPGGGGGLSQDVLDALRKQLAAQPPEGEGDSKAPSTP